MYFAIFTKFLIVTELQVFAYTSDCERSTCTSFILGLVPDEYMYHC